MAIMSNSTGKNNVSSILLVFALGFLIVMGSLVIQHNNDFLYAFSQGKMKNWKQGYKYRGIKEISITIDTSISKSINRNQRFLWYLIKRLYLNKEKINPTQLKYSADFFIHKCEENYILLPNKSIDSIVYKFSPICIYEEYNSERELIFSTIEFNSKRKLNKKYSDLLPSCH